MNRNMLADALFVAALMVYVWVGVQATPFHADEFMQMSMARDVFYLAHGDLGSLRFAPPVQPDTEQHLRLLNGPINKDLIGIVWALDGRTESALPEIFAWALPLDWNRDHGNVPSADGLDLAREPSALLAALSVAAMFGLGRMVGGRAMAYPAALLYTLHPVILLNGRRAMMESALLFFTLLLIAIGIWISRLADPESPSPPAQRRWGGQAILLGLGAGLTIAAKHTGLIAVAGVFAGVLWATWKTDNRAALLRLIGAGLVALAVFLTLNPAYWNDPIGAARATLTARSDLLAMQSQNDPTTYTNLQQRFSAIIGQPFLTPVQYYEAPTWNGVIDDTIQQYEASPVSGWRWPPLIGWLLTLMAFVGAALIGWRALHDHEPAARVLLAWFAAALVGSLATPLAWQRYYLPLFPVMIVLAAYLPAALRSWLRPR